MIEELKTTKQLVKRAILAPHRITLATLWLLTTICLVVMLFSEIRHTNQYQAERYILQVAYTLALIWYMSRTGPSLTQLPYLEPFLLPKRNIGKLLPVIFIIFLLGTEFYARGLTKPLMMIAAIWILIVYRHEIGLKQVLLGFMVAIIALVGGFPFLQNQFIKKSAFMPLLVFTVPMFVAGGLLSKRAGLVGSQVHSGQYINALRSCLLGCAFFVPFGLLNAATGSPGKGFTWVTYWWMPLSLPWFSGIVEEAWFRLLLVTLCYYMLRPAFNRMPAVPIALSVLFSGIVFGLGHGGDLMDRFLTTGLLYGVPMAAIYIRRDWEHSVGAHYMINMIPWMMVYLENR